MLGKLLKYDFRAMWKQFSIIWPAALVIALINRFTLPFNRGGGSEVEAGVRSELLAMITITVFVGVMCAMFVVAMVFVLTRFYRGLLGDEGYLMHTLPVKTWQLLLSKLICAVVVTVINVAVSILAMFLMMPINWIALFDMELWKRLVQGLLRQPDALLYLGEFFLLCVSALVLMVTMVYLSMSIGHLFHRRRVLMSVAAFFVLDIAGNLVISLFGELGIMEILDAMVLWSSHGGFWVGIFLLLLPAVLMFFAASYLLKHHLNLE